MIAPKSRSSTLLGRRLASAVAVLLLGAFVAEAATRVLYETRFEPHEGYDETLTLVGQGGWVGVGTGGNGLIDNLFVAEGQHAFIGFAAPLAEEPSLSVWRPIGYVPEPDPPSTVRFSVLMSVEDSTTSNRDHFRWTVYNRAEQRLFGLDFDNETLAIRYVLDDDAGFVPTGRTFTNSVDYRLELRIDFAGNRWSASLNDSILATNLAVTTRNRALDLGDIDAEWLIRSPTQPGDNYMVFDNYRVVVEDAVPNPPPRLQALGQLRPGEFLVRCFGVPQTPYRLEFTADWTEWTPIKTNIVPGDGYFDHLDRGGGPRRFYRLVEH